MSPIPTKATSSKLMAASFPLARVSSWCYNLRVLNTPLTKLRKDAPGSITAADVAAHFKRRRFPRDARTIGDFERAIYKSPPDRMFELYAECVGRPVSVVRAAYARTRAMRERSVGPFANENGIAQPQRHR